MTSDKSRDLENRICNLAKSIISSIKKVKITALNKRIIEQIVGSSGSIGANYCEANESESKKDFMHKIKIAKKEARETKHWLRLLSASNPELNSDLKKYYTETQEIILIFSKVISTCQKSIIK